MTIWCIGRNYKDHALEMKAEIPTSPLVFIKSGGCLSNQKTITLPFFSQDVHHELEIALRLDHKLNFTEVALALDLTARDIQAELKKKGQPWAMSKSFKGSCPVSSWIPLQNQKWFESLQFQLTVNGQVRQLGKTQDMIFSCQDILEYLKDYYPLQGGDIVLTGTPEGVGPLKAGDRMKAEISGHLHWEWEVLNP